MPVPYTFANQTGPLPLSDLDANFAYVPDLANVANTVSNPVQANITSLGTLTGVTVSGNVLATGINASTISATGNTVTQGLVAQGMYINNSGLANAIVTGNLHVQGNISYFDQGTISTGNLTITVGNNLAAQNLTGAGLVAGGPVSLVGNILYNYATNSWQTNLNWLPVSNTAAVNLGGVSNYWNTIYATQLVMSGNIVSGNITSNSYLASSVSASGNITGGNVFTSGIISTAANIVASANITATNLFANSLSVTGTITLSGLTASGNLYANGVTTGNVTAANVTTGNILNSGNIFTNGVSATGNVAGNYLLGNGYYINGISTTATAISNPGGWSVTPIGTKLYFNYNGSNVGSLDSSGNFIVLGDVTAFGTP
jgi:hypothetical protein